MNSFKVSHQTGDLAAHDLRRQLKTPSTIPPTGICEGRPRTFAQAFYTPVVGDPDNGKRLALATAPRFDSRDGRPQITRRYGRRRVHHAGQWTTRRSQEGNGLVRMGNPKLTVVLESPDVRRLLLRFRDPYGLPPWRLRGALGVQIRRLGVAVTLQGGQPAFALPLDKDRIRVGQHRARVLGTNVPRVIGVHSPVDAHHTSSLWLYADTPTRLVLAGFTLYLGNSIAPLGSGGVRFASPEFEQYDQEVRRLLGIDEGTDTWLAALLQGQHIVTTKGHLETTWWRPPTPPSPVQLGEVTVSIRFAATPAAVLHVDAKLEQPPTDAATGAAWPADAAARPPLWVTMAARTLTAGSEIAGLTIVQTLPDILAAVSP
jgi:hypothetical protein